MFSSHRAVKHFVDFDIVLQNKSTSLFSAPSRPFPLPFEIILIILESAYYNDHLESNNNLLRDCALVSKVWSSPAQTLLFRNVSLRNHNAYLAFHAALANNTALSNAVVRLRVVLDHNQPLHIAHPDFAHAVSLCPNLYELSISLYGSAAPGKDIVGLPDVSRMRRPAPSFDDSSLALLKSGPKISALHFSNWSDNTRPFFQLLHIYPSLKSLVITGTPPHLPSPAPQPFFPCALEQLRINFQTHPSIDFLIWLLHNSSHSLRILELEREPSSELLNHLVLAHGPALHSLALPACGSHEHALAVQTCQHLREFKIENPWASPMVFRRLPNVVQHVALGLDRDTALQPVLDLVKSRTSLTVVSLHVWDGGEHHPQLPALKIACAYRGVDLRLTRDVRVFRSMIRGDPIPTTSFPRAKSLQNLQYMRSVSTAH